MIFFSFLFLAVGFSPAYSANLTVEQIIEKNESARKYSDVTSHANLTTGGGGKAERIKEFTWWKKLSGDKVHFKTLTRFHSPIEVKNEGILFLEAGGDKTEVLLYLPSYRKARRVENSQQSSSFMGSEFSYADIATPHKEDFDYKLLREDNCPAYAGASLKCYVVEYKPNKESVTDRTASAKGILWIRQDNFIDVKTEIFDLEQKPWKTMEAKEIKEIDPVNKKWLAHYLRMDNLKTGRFTTFTLTEVKVNKNITDAIFTQQNLSREE